MKRFVLLIALSFAVSALCFARGGGNIELFGGVPLNWERGEMLGDDVTAQMTSLSFGFAGISRINDRIAKAGDYRGRGNSKSHQSRLRHPDGNVCLVWPGFLPVFRRHVKSPLDRRAPVDVAYRINKHSGNFWQ